jgi:hypothetical protein
MGSNTCVLASEGYFVLNSGMASQTICPNGESQPLTGQTECILDSVDSGISNLIIIGGIGGVVLLGAAFLMRPNSKPKVSKGNKKVRKKKKQ